ncbi:hypothetical protein JHK86_009838 [Glycine max]|nr:hypothetical protein JHK86_009838 [Glycine max]
MLLLLFPPELFSRNRHCGVTSTNGPEVNGGQLAGSGQPPTITLVIDGNQSYVAPTPNDPQPIDKPSSIDSHNEVDRRFVIYVEETSDENKKGRIHGLVHSLDLDITPHGYRFPFNKPKFVYTSSRRHQCNSYTNDLNARVDACTVKPTNTIPNGVADTTNAGTVKGSGKHAYTNEGISRMQQQMQTQAIF